MDIKQIQKDLEKKIKKNKFIEEPSETAETQKQFKKGTNLENETEKMKQLIHLQQNLQKIFKKSDLEHSEKKLNVIDEDEDEDEGDNNNASPIQGNIEYTPKKIQKIINLKNNLQNNYRKTVLNDKYTAEEKVKHYEPILKALSNVESSVNDVKEVAIKTDNDIQKMIIPPYKPKNPELHRLMSTEETFETPKKSRQKSITNSPMPTDTIKLGPNATKYLPTIEPNNSFGIYYDKDFEDHMIGKCMITFENDDIILNGKKYKGTVGLWRLLTHSDVTRPEYYTEDDFKIYKEILIETDSIYQNNDKSTGRAKSSGGAKYVSMNSNIWKEINEKKRPITKPTTKPIGEGLRQYTDDRYIDNMKQLTDRLQLIAAEERAGNNNYHNEKLGILHLCKTSMEKIIDTPNGIEYLLLYVTNLPKEVVKISKDSIIKKIYFVSNDERKGNNIYHDEKLNILNICIREMENLIDIPNNGAHYLYSYVSCLPKKIIKGSGFINDFLNCSFLPELHWPGYNYLGPGIKLEKNKKPINKLDEAARDHDYFYKDHKDTKTRHEADKILEQKAMERFNAPDTNMNEKIPALLTAYAMKSKRHLGMNLKKKLAEACKNNTNAIIQIVSDKIYKGQNIFYLDQNQIDKLKNSKEKKSGVRLEITPKQIKKKEGGFLPLILPFLEAAAVATPAIVALYDSYKDNKHKKKMEEETIRHNKEMEKNKGVYTIFWSKEKNINIEPLSNFDINHFGNNIKNFRGCFMRNDLPMKSWVNECGVLNLNDSTQNGSHWVAWKKMKNKKIYFDSFGINPPPKELVNYLGKHNLWYTDRKFQDYNDPPICGHLCLEFIDNYKKFI
ncbi:hypothetical protein AGLY_011531 [Aphis glycines]|uniref:Uncharacterized protein n=1 Tax=Aphis glycines TaxID=307491 RepID=A0A6G0TD47_APHGL|nr:hypothetical protein AGLY_011531 [Aphis glycines]